jgi:hypothetical protein
MIVCASFSEQVSGASHIPPGDVLLRVQKRVYLTLLGKSRGSQEKSRAVAKSEKGF